MLFRSDRRLTPIGRAAGLVGDARWERFERKVRRLEELTAALEAAHNASGSAMKYLRRPEVEWPQLAAAFPEFGGVSGEIARELSIDAKYAGYIERQRDQIAQAARWEKRRIPEGFDYGALEHLRSEAKEKLQAVRPETLGQAARISGITPADIAFLMVVLQK